MDLNGASRRRALSCSQCRANKLLRSFEDFWSSSAKALLNSSSSLRRIAVDDEYRPLYLRSRISFLDSVMPLAMNSSVSKGSRELLYDGLMGLSATFTCRSKVSFCATSTWRLSVYFLVIAAAYVAERVRGIFC